MDARIALHSAGAKDGPATDLRHDARNLLQVIDGYLELIARTATDPVLVSYTANARAATEQLIALSAQMPGMSED